MNENKYTMDILYVVVSPRWKWFQPPLWKCFMWAYKKEKELLLKNCYPKSMNTNVDESSVNIEFQSFPYENEKINDMTNEILKRFGLEKDKKEDDE